MPEGSRDETFAPHLDRASGAAPGAARFTLQVLERTSHCRLVPEPHLPRDVALGDTPQHADALGRAERQIESGHRSGRERSPQRVARRRILGAQQPVQPALVDLAGQPERRGPSPGPLPGRLALARVVVLPTLRDLFDVIAPRVGPGGELADGEHTPVCRASARSTPRGVAPMCQVARSDSSSGRPR